MWLGRSSSSTAWGTAPAIHSSASWRRWKQRARATQTNCVLWAPTEATLSARLGRVARSDGMATAKARLSRNSRMKLTIKCQCKPMWPSAVHAAIKQVGGYSTPRNADQASIMQREFSIESTALRFMQIQHCNHLPCGQYEISSPCWDDKGLINLLQYSLGHSQLHNWGC